MRWYLDQGWVLCCALAVSGCYEGANGEADTEGGTGDASSMGGTQGGTDTDDGGEPIPDDIEPESVPEPLAARLTDTQYRYSVLDVLGVTLTEQEEEWLPRDVPIEGSYSTSVETQFFNTQYVLGYAYIARSISERLDPIALRSEHGDCGDTSSECIEAFVQGLGLRLFRRPLSAEEIQTYAQLAEAIASASETEDADVVQGLVQAMMQAPQFLYRLEQETDGEPGTLRRIDGYELASRLSYFLWQSAPDAELLEFAAQPYDSDAVAAQVERMIADPKFARSRELFWADYSLASVSGFGTTDEALTQEYRESLLATLLRISGVDAPPQPLSALFDGQELVMTGQVAELAGAMRKGDDLQVYDVSETEARLGVVTHPSFIASIGTTSFVGRGVFMTERLLCQHTAPPPDDEATAAAIMDTAQQTAEMTPREASEYRFGLEPICQGCHFQFEPIAYAFERYDVAGQFTLTDEQGRDLYSDGTLPQYADRPEIPFESAPELLTELADTDSVHACFVENMMQYATGHTPHGADDFLDQAQAEYDGDGQTFDALAESVANSEMHSLMRVVAP